MSLKEMLSNDLSNNDEIDEEKRAHMDEKIDKIGNMLTDFISEFNLGDLIQQNMSEILNLTQNGELNQDPISFMKFLNVASSLANSFADTFKDKNGKPDKRKLQEQGKLMKAHMKMILKEVNKPLPEKQTENDTLEN